jgi:hypothetical protein
MEFNYFLTRIAYNNLCTIKSKAYYFRGIFAAIQFLIFLSSGLISTNLRLQI